MNESSMNEQWVDGILPKCTSFTNAMISLVEILLEKDNIDYLSVSGRTKTRDGVLEKIRRKNYQNPKLEITDISGLRIVTFLESQVELASSLIRKSFIVDENNSLDKTKLLGTNQIGYRSVHFVCKLNKERLSLPEYASFSDIMFEIQIRTVLQHAWAELAHDRVYKFSGVLPDPLKRRLHLYAGMLEIADYGFDELAKELDTYANSVENRAANGDLDIEINTVSITAYLSQFLNGSNYHLFNDKLKKIVDEVCVAELRSFGIKTLGDLSKLFSADFTQAIKDHPRLVSYKGLLRQAMVFNNIDLYFQKSWKTSWTKITNTKMFVKKYGREKLLGLFEKYNISHDLDE